MERNQKAKQDGVSKQTGEKPSRVDIKGDGNNWAQMLPKSKEDEDWDATMVLGSVAHTLKTSMEF